LKRRRTSVSTAYFQMIAGSPVVDLLEQSRAGSISIPEGGCQLARTGQSLIHSVFSRIKSGPCWVSPLKRRLRRRPSISGSVMRFQSRCRLPSTDLQSWDRKQAVSSELSRFQSRTRIELSSYWQSYVEPCSSGWHAVSSDF
jgi:hypothetical protein